VSEGEESGFTVTEASYLEFKRGKPASIYLDRKKAGAYEGETIAAALCASG